MRPFCTLLAGILGVCLVVAAPVPKSLEKPGDEEVILGTWKITGVEWGRAKVSGPDDWKEIEYKFGEQGRFAIDLSGRPDFEGGFKLDTTTKPKALELLNTDQSRKQLVAYELDGDTLRLCLTQKPNAARPNEFKGEGRAIVYTLTRVKDAKGK